MRSVQMRENADHINSEYEHFLHSVGFQDLIFVLSCSNVSEFLPQEELCSIFGDQDIWVSLNDSWLFLLTLTESQFASEGNIVEYSSVQKIHVLLQQLDFFLFYTGLLPIFLDFLHEL